MRKIMIFALILGFLAGTALGAETPQDALQVMGPQTAAKVTFQTMEAGKVLVSVTDDQDAPILGLNAEQFTIRKGPKTAKILSAEPLATSKEVGLNIVMVVDNSQSMQMRHAVQPLRDALEAFYKTVRPIDHVTTVVFDDRNTTAVNGRALHARMMETRDVNQMRAFVAESLTNGLTNGTYLYDAMMIGLDQVRRMPAKSNKFMVIFSDGEDINSSVKRSDVEQAAGDLSNFAAYAVDYMPGATTDNFLQRFSTGNSGRTWKAASAAELLPVFQAFSSTLLHRYVVSYRFLEAPTGTLAFGTPELTIEEITTIDSAPLLNYIFFETGSGELSTRYKLFKSQAETAAFAEANLRGAMDKYQNVLNIIGKRLQDHPEATIRLVGCNSNVDQEKGRTDLSLSRAEAVRAYLRYVWGIDPQRMAVEYRNLPEAPSTNRIVEGQAENQRAEIYSNDPAILDTVNSEYVQKVSDQDQLRIVPDIQSEAGLANWKVTVMCGQDPIQTFEGQGDLPGEFTVPLEATLLEQIAGCQNVRSAIQAVDKETNELQSPDATTLPVHFIQRKEQMAQIQGYKVKEQYALILFDYDSAAIKARNQVVVQRILDRLKKIPDATVSVVGHTDTIGSEEYNLKLSEKRADAVQAQILTAAAPLADKLTVRGAGPSDPLYDNNLPEGRALNRTVTITLEYLQNQQ